MATCTKIFILCYLLLYPHYSFVFDHVTIVKESNADNDATLPNISDAALAQSLVALNCYKCSPVQNCTCPKYMCTCCIL